MTSTAPYSFKWNFDGPGLVRQHGLVKASEFNFEVMFDAMGLFLPVSFFQLQVEEDVLPSIDLPASL